MPIILTDRFDAAYASLPLDVRNKVGKALRLLDSNPRHPSLQVHPVQGHHGIYAARVDQKYRMTFEFDGQAKILRNVDNHDECLKNP